MNRSDAVDLPMTMETRGLSAKGWKVRLPGYGQSTPVVWKEKVFVTAVSGNEKENLHVLAFELSTGVQLWEKTFPSTQRVKDSDSVSRAAPTPAVDQDALFACFESGDIIALNHAGETLWTRSFVGDYGDIKGPHGYASSPLLHDDRLIVQVAHAGPSYILSLDTKDGSNAWKVDHPSQTGWSSPVLQQGNGFDAVIISTAGSVRSLKLSDGSELWSTEEVSGNSTASPTLVSGRSIIIGASADRGGPSRGDLANSKSTATDSGKSDADTKAYSGSMLIRVEGDGATSSEVAWRNPRIQTSYASPVVLGDLGYFITKVGVLNCVDLQTGEILWTERLPGPVWATPIVSGNNVYFFCKDGSVVVIESNRNEFKMIAESQVSTTDIIYGVAAVDKCWIVRTGRGLICIR